MKQKMKSLFMNPWVVTVGGGIVLAGLTAIYDLINKEKVFTTIKRIIQTIFKTIVNILNFNLKVWWILLIVVILIAVVFLVKSFASRIQSEEVEPEFLNYRNDKILGYKWKWQWEKSYDGKYHMKNLHPVCLKCETPLPDDIRYYSGRHKCIRCGNYHMETLPEEKDVMILIHDNIRRKYYPNE